MTATLTVLPECKINTTEIPYISRVERIPDIKPGESRPKLDRDYISPSQIKKYQRCQAAYWFHYGEGLREGSDSSLVRGSAVHEAAFAYHYFLREAERAGKTISHEELLQIALGYADDYITHELAILEQLPAIARNFEWKPAYKGAKTVMNAETLRKNVRDGVTLLAEQSWRNIRPVQLEVGYLIHWQDENDADPARRTLPMLAYADRIEEHEFFGNMEAEVTDVKTGSRKSKDDVDLDSALTAYCAAHEVFTGIRTRRVSYENLVCNATLLNERVAADEERSIHHFGRLYRLARGLTNARRNGDFLPVDDGMKCGSCDFRKRCTQLFV